MMNYFSQESRYCSTRSQFEFFIGCFGNGDKEDSGFPETTNYQKKLSLCVEYISRVNRTYQGKEYGLIVDYAGITEYIVIQKSSQRYKNSSC